MRLAKDGSLVLTLPEAAALIVTLMILVVWLFLINIKLGWWTAFFILLLAVHVKVKHHDRSDE